MDIVEAMIEVATGAKVVRSPWIGSGPMTYIFEDSAYPGFPSVFVEGASVVPHYEPSLADMMADDWVVVLILTA